jgi:uncharacterized repeat protein (TIGR01451 family)
VGTVNPTGSQTLTIAAMVVSPAAETNAATISHADQFDPDPANNQASATVTPQQADLALTKTVDNPLPNVGDTITYTITLSNNGPDSATGVNVTDPLPAGVSFVVDSASEGSYDPVSGIWTVGSVAVGVPQVLTITALVSNPDESVNTAFISHAEQFDPDPANNSASSSVTPEEADLALTKTVDDPTPNVGDIVTFTVTLTNNGPNTGTDVTVADPLPPGLEFVSASASAGSYDSNAGSWTVGAVTVATPQTLQIQAMVISPDAQTNTATISHADQFDPNPANNTASTIVTPQQADLALTKTVSDATPNVGRYRHLHCHVDKQWPRHGHQRPGGRSPAG